MIPAPSAAATRVTIDTAAASPTYAEEPVSGKSCAGTATTESQRWGKVQPAAHTVLL